MEKILQTKITALLLAMVMIGISSAAELQAQFTEEPEFIVITRDNGPVYVYHTTTLPLGYRYHMYRRLAEESEEENRRLNTEPLESASSETELRSRLGSLYWELRTSLTAASDNREILYTLRNDRSTGMMAAFLHTDVAEAIGRLWIDEDAEPYQTVIYTIEVLDEFNDPVGEYFTHQTELIPARPPAPAGLSGQNEGRYITLRWNYPAGETGAAGNVLYFNVYRVLDNGGRQKINPAIITRNRAEATVEYEFSVGSTGHEYTFTVEAVDVSGQPGYPAEHLTLEVFDNTLPDFITGVEGLSDEDGNAMITWPMATESRAAGYNIYRGESSEEGAALQRLNREPVPVRQTSYVDSLAGRSGESELWFYRVTVVSQEGLESLYSNAAMVHLPVMEAPPPAFDLTAEVLDDGGVLLSWAAPDMPERFSTWVVMRQDRSHRATDTAVRISGDSLLTTRFTDYGETDFGLTEGAEYEYLVASQDGDKHTSEFVSAVVMMPKTTPPDAPTLVQAHNDQGIRVQINWNPSRDLFTESYRLYRNLPGGEPEAVAQTAARALSYRDEEVDSGQTYIYMVTATDSFGNTSEFSEPDTIFVRTFNIPRTVRNVRAEELDEGGVRIWWEPVPDSDLAGYRVFRSPIPTGVFEEIHPQLIDESGFVDSEGSRGMWYRVRAYDTSTNESRASEAAQAR